MRAIAQDILATVGLTQSEQVRLCCRCPRATAITKKQRVNVKITTAITTLTTTLWFKSNPASDNTLAAAHPTSWSLRPFFFAAIEPSETMTTHTSRRGELALHRTKHAERGAAHLVDRTAAR